MKSSATCRLILTLPMILLGLWAGCGPDGTDNGFTDEVIPYPFEVRLVSREAELERLEAAYRKRMSEDPRGAMPLVGLATVLTSKARVTGEMSLYDEAERLARQSLERLPYSNETAKLVLASVAEARHRFPEAIELAGEALKAKPGDEAVLAALVTANLGYGKLEAAQKYADELVSRKPTMKARSLRALVLEARGNEREALQEFENAIRTEDIGQFFDSAWNRTFLGRLHMSRGRYELAEAYFREALRILPNCHLALALLAKLEWEAGDTESADRLYTEAFNAMGEPPYLLEHAELKLEMGQEAEANRLRDEAEKLVRDEMARGPYGHHNELARLLLDRGGPEHIQEAVTEAQKDAEMRQDAASHALLAEALYKAKEWQAARESIQTALSSGKKDAELFYLASAIERAMGNTAKAEELQRKAKEINPRFKPDRGLL